MEILLQGNKRKGEQSPPDTRTPIKIWGDIPELQRLDAQKSHDSINNLFFREAFTVPAPATHLTYPISSHLQATPRGRHCDSSYIMAAISVQGEAGTWTQVCPEAVILSFCSPSFWDFSEETFPSGRRFFQRILGLLQLGWSTYRKEKEYQAALRPETWAFCWKSLLPAAWRVIKY